MFSHDLYFDFVRLEMIFEIETDRSYTNGTRNTPSFLFYYIVIYFNCIL